MMYSKGRGHFPRKLAIADGRGFDILRRALTPSIPNRSLDRLMKYYSLSIICSLLLAVTNALAGEGVQVNAVCPGATETDLLEQIRREEPGSEFDWIHRPEEVAEEVAKLVCPFAQTTSGRVVSMKPAAEVLGMPVR